MKKQKLSIKAIRAQRRAVAKALRAGRESFAVTEMTEAWLPKIENALHEDAAARELELLKWIARAKEKLIGFLMSVDMEEAEYRYLRNFTDSIED